MLPFRTTALAAASFFALASADADLSRTLSGHAGHECQLQRAIGGKLAGPWENVGAAVLGSGSPIALTIAGGAVVSPAFFRIQVDP